MSKSHTIAIHWFRKGLRLHDNPALLAACGQATKIIPLFILDPHFANPGTVSPRRYQFLLETLSDLDTNLREKYGTQLYVARGTPNDVLPRIVSELKATLLTFEADTEPYARARDQALEIEMKSHGVKVEQHWSHTLHDITELANLCPKNKPPTVYQSFLKHVFHKAGSIPKPVPLPTSIDSLTLQEFQTFVTNVPDMSIEKGIPSLEELGYPAATPCAFQGGETAGLERMQSHLARKQWIASFEKPKTAPNALTPSTTVLSPYLKFGCVSARTFWYGLQEVYKTHKGPRSLPPTSLDGQLLWREFYYTSAYLTANYDQMKGNPICRQIEWIDPDTSIEASTHLKAWQEGKTGFPFIDAIMIQLKQEGWIHHLARHAVACFLTRGDLFINWEHGVRHFEWALLDADWSINVGNWMWLSASCYFYQYFRCYSPIAFGKKTDKNGDYIRKYLPQLKNYPKKYIYEPWTAPLAIQKEAGCIIGVDYPEPIVEHKIVSKRNMMWMKEAYAKHNANKNAGKKKRSSSGGSGGSGGSSSSSSSSSKKTKR